MVLLIINKILILLFFMSCLNAIRRTYYFIQAWISSSSEEPVKYILNKKDMWILAASIAYILTVLFTGINI